MVAFLEEDIEKLLRNQSVARNGQLQSAAARMSPPRRCSMSMRRRCRRCVERLSEIAKQLNAGYNIDLAALLALPGIVQPVLPDEQEAQQIKDVILKMSQKAVEQLKADAGTRGHCALRRI